MPKYYFKQPGEIERIGVDFKNALSSGESVSSATYTITDSNGNDVTTTMMVSGSGLISDEDSDGVDETASARIQAGTDGQDYKFTIKATTSGGDIVEEDIIIQVKEK